MKNIIVIIVASVLCTLSVQANPAHKAKDKIANPHHGIKNKVEHKKNKAQNPQKKKLISRLKRIVNLTINLQIGPIKENQEILQKIKRMQPEAQKRNTKKPIKIFINGLIKLRTLLNQE